MSVLSWGKGTVEYIKSVDGEPDPSGTWKTFPEIKENTTKFQREPGEAKEAKEEGGAIVDVRYNKGKATIEFELFVKKGDVQPIEDDDGVILDRYAIRITPEDTDIEGFQMDCASVNVSESWSTDEGRFWKYVFTALKPKTGKMVKPYRP